MNLLLINGFWMPSQIIDEFLTHSQLDSNISLTFPLSIMTIAGWCRQELPTANIEVIDFMAELHKFISNTLILPTDFNSFATGHLLKNSFTPDYIGISVSSSNGYNANLKLLAICKQLFPNSKIIIGGMHATTFTKSFIGKAGVDYIIRGAGDIAFTDLLKCLIKNQSPLHIAGVVNSTDNIASLSPPLTDLDAIPQYPYDLIDMEYLITKDDTSPIMQEGARTGMVMTSRGCPFTCTYCSASQIHSRKVAFHTVERVIKEIKYLLDTFKINQICIMDDLFGANKKLFFNLFKAIDEEKLKFKIVIPAGLSLKLYNQEMLDILIAHGVESAYFPLESGSQYVQDHIINKHIKLSEAIKLIKYAKDKKLFTGINIVIGSPNETKDMMYETYQFLKKLPVDWIQFFSAYPYPGTEMTNILLNRQDLTEDTLINIWDTSTQGFKKRSFDTVEIKGEELAELVYDFNIQLNFFNNYNMRVGDFITPVTKFSKIIERYPYHIIAILCRAKCYYEQNLIDNAEQDIEDAVTTIKQSKESEQMFTKYRDNIIRLFSPYGIKQIIELYNSTNQ